MDRFSDDLREVVRVGGVDLFVRKDRPFDLLALDRSARMALPADPTQQVAVLTAEDVIVLKLEWYRLGDEVSEQQWRDILGLLKIQGRTSISSTCGALPENWGWPICLSGP